MPNFARLIIKLLFVVAVIAVISSCIPQKRLILMQYDDMIDSTYALTFDGTDYEDSIYRIQENDYLYIDIKSVEGSITDIFKSNATIFQTGDENQSLVGYYVNSDGTIDYPYVGRIYLKGQTLREAMETVKIASESLVGNARVEVRLINNTISILGEVVKQGSYNITKTQVSIYEAITLAQGFTDYAKRNKVKVLRTVDGERKLYMIDLNSGKLIGQNMFFVYPNDIIYVEPMWAKSIGLTPTFSLTVITTVLTLVVLISSISK
ncbi:MAG: polysaccharide biosynthesis/export family protein [Bacteroidota bacterium]